MALSVGIVGLPNVGKSTLFNALTRLSVPAENFPFCTIEPNVGVVEVPDKRLEQLSALVEVEKVVPTAIRFVDIAGLVKGASKGEGLGNKFLAHIREVDLIVHVVRTFEDENVAHVHDKVDPNSDIEVVNTELSLKDLETVSRKMAELAPKAKAAKADDEIHDFIDILRQLQDALEKDRLDILEERREKNKIGDREEKFIKELNLLTAKPVLYLLNADSEGVEAIVLDKDDKLVLDLKDEVELSELTPDELRDLGIEASGLEKFVKMCYKLLGLVTFYTFVGGKELRAWSLRRGGTVLEAAGKIHSDFAEKFIKAEVASYKDLVRYGGWEGAKEQGKIRVEGRDYNVKDGDVVEIKV